ncbi:PE-PGRS family protein [uncultured phage_MedDCM-OCT-S42-C7]|uniref:PE-PGRS family protein n=1 Tax=uncultured phage_MedDCM-OCT-S42-C7 TaxID=2741073 RepID=A0A6S4PI89_9CAUD|nr:PE-PGRS family protein [uncultured phage_MedDCM-OCT-S42-C7]BAQ94126.1 PE-PGRS family protein [uncultured phage_MedDCM-OCT-S42-C7]
MARNRDLSKLLSTANGKIVGSNLDVSFENISDTGTEGTKVASGTTAQRGSTTGQIRFNSTTGLAEYYTGNVFKSIDIAPMITSVNNTNISGDSITAGFDLVISGTNFATGATVKFIGNDGTQYSSPTVTINSGEQITARINTNIDPTKEPFDVQVTSAGGLSSLKEDAFNIDAVPAWTTASGSIGGGFNGDSINLQVTATDPDGSISSYAIQSGALPSGVSLNTSTGAITGTLPTVGSVTTNTFTVRATSNSGQTTDRQFNIVNGGSGSTSINTSSGNFTISQNQPVKVYVIGGGGGGGGDTGDTLSSNEEYGGGGGGGMAYKLFPNLTAGTYSFTVGSGGTGGSATSNPTAGGSSSLTAGGITVQATGGGHGGTDNVDGGGYTVYTGGSSGRGSFGGAGGVGSGGDINGTGGKGGAGADDYTLTRTYTTESAYTSGEDTSAGKNGINGGAGGGGAGSEAANDFGAGSFSIAGHNHGGNGSSTYFTGGGGGGGIDGGGGYTNGGGANASGGTGYTSGGQGSGDSSSNTASNGSGSVGGAKGSGGGSRGNAGGGGGSHGGGGGGGADPTNGGGGVGSGAGGGGAVVIVS